MPLYLVRWPGLEASIVRADDEDHLTDILDEVASPTEATWSEYDGPLWVDVKLGITLAGDEEEGWRLEGVEEAAADPTLGIALTNPDDCDTAGEMFDAVFAKAFPNLAGLLESAADESSCDEGLDPKKVGAAAAMDLRIHRGSGMLPASLRELFKTYGAKGPGSRRP